MKWYLLSRWFIVSFSMIIAVLILSRLLILDSATLYSPKEERVDTTRELQTKWLLIYSENLATWEYEFRKKANAYKLIGQDPGAAKELQKKSIRNRYIVLTGTKQTIRILPPEGLINFPKSLSERVLRYQIEQGNIFVKQLDASWQEFKKNDIDIIKTGMIWQLGDRQLQIRLTNRLGKSTRIEFFSRRQNSVTKNKDEQPVIKKDKKLGILSFGYIPEQLVDSEGRETFEKEAFETGAAYYKNGFLYIKTRAEVELQLKTETNDEKINALKQQLTSIKKLHHVGQWTVKNIVHQFNQSQDPFAIRVFFPKKVMDDFEYKGQLIKGWQQKLSDHKDWLPITAWRENNSIYLHLSRPTAPEYLSTPFTSKIRWNCNKHCLKNEKILAVNPKDTITTIEDKTFSYLITHEPYNNRSKQAFWSKRAFYSYTKKIIPVQWKVIRWPESRPGNGLKFTQSPVAEGKGDWYPATNVLTHRVGIETVVYKANIPNKAALLKLDGPGVIDIWTKYQGLLVSSKKLPVTIKFSGLNKNNRAIYIRVRANYKTIGGNDIVGIKVKDGKIEKLTQEVANYKKRTPAEMVSFTSDSSHSNIKFSVDHKKELCLKSSSGSTLFPLGIHLCKTHQDQQWLVFADKKNKGDWLTEQYKKEGKRQAENLFWGWNGKNITFHHTASPTFSIFTPDTNLPYAPLTERGIANERYRKRKGDYQLSKARDRVIVRPGNKFSGLSFDLRKTQLKFRREFLLVANLTNQNLLGLDFGHAKPPEILDDLKQQAVSLSWDSNNFLIYRPEKSIVKVKVNGVNIKPDKKIQLSSGDEVVINEHYYFKVSEQNQKKDLKALLPGMNWLFEDHEFSSTIKKLADKFDQPIDIELTYDPAIQQLAYNEATRTIQTVIEGDAKRKDKLHKYKLSNAWNAFNQIDYEQWLSVDKHPEAAIVVLDEKSRILASVSVGNAEQNNLAWGIAKAPGSTFKIATALAALSSNNKDVIHLVKNSSKNIEKKFNLKNVKFGADGHVIPFELINSNNDQQGSSGDKPGLISSVKHSENMYFSYLGMHLDNNLIRKEQPYSSSSYKTFWYRGLLEPEQREKEWSLLHMVNLLGGNQRLNLLGQINNRGVIFDKLIEVYPSYGHSAPVIASLSYATIRPEEVAFSSIGQGNTISTPLFAATSALAVANNGIILPRILDSIKNKETGKLLFEQEGNKVPFKFKTEPLKKGMRAVTLPGGTARRPFAPFYKEFAGIRVYGKTGTTQTGKKFRTKSGKGRANITWNHSWFTGWMETPDNKKYAIGVIVPHSGSGAWVAGDLAERVLRGIALNQQLQDKK